MSESFLLLLWGIATSLHDHDYMTTARLSFRQVVHACDGASTHSNEGQIRNSIAYRGNTGALVEVGRSIFAHDLSWRGYACPN